MQNVRTQCVTPPPPHFIVAFLLWLTIVIAVPAHAGTYSVVYSGGQFALTNSSGNPTTLPYALAAGQWGGSGTGYWSYGNGSAVAQGDNYLYLHLAIYWVPMMFHPFRSSLRITPP